VQLPPFSNYFIPLRSKYSPQNPVLKQAQSMYALPLMWDTKFHAHTKQLAELCFCMF
jgi:hypothetical protein